jgi:hypothetical protein
VDGDAKAASPACTATPAKKKENLHMIPTRLFAMLGALTLQLAGLIFLHVPGPTHAGPLAPGALAAPVVAAPFSNTTSLIQGGLPQVNSGTVAWGDYDADGKLDFLITGSANGAPTSKLYHRTATGFVEASAGVLSDLPQVRFAAVAWGDYDNEGRLDFLISGSDPTNTLVTALYHNMGDHFTNASNTVQGELPGLESPTIAWGDYDHDGRLDFLLPGEAPSLAPVSRLYRCGWAKHRTAAAGLPGSSTRCRSTIRL